MKIGVIFPQTEIGADVAGVRDYAQAVEGMGYSHLLAYDHVVGAAPEGRDFPMAYTDQSQFHEPLVLFGFLAGVTRNLGLATDVIILPQRQAVLVAKQAAEIDVLSNGRLRLGVGIGWNPVEYEALGENFHNRGRRIEEQVEVMRRLWTQPVVDYRGKWLQIDRAGINPLPIQRPIPVWFGGSAEPALQRLARIADGWFPNRKPPEGWAAVVERVRGYVQAAGRNPAAFGIEGRLNAANHTPDQWRAEVEEWRNIGANYLGVNTMGAGLKGSQAHLERLRKVKEELGI
ncbi:MAG TPA: LLM class F420-dependent oxidoreductase [Chloroflexota bacterium]|nr:LLM class F420-dependent oxidoreductase [Chloroflexota bacterium]